MVSAQSADSRLVRLSIDGSSPPIPIAEWDPAWRDGIWLSDGDLLIQTAGTTKFLRIPSTGGAPQPPVAFDFGGLAGYPRFFSEVAGGGVLMQVERWGPQGYQQDIWLLDPGTGKARRLIDNGGSPRYVASIGCILFSRGPAVMAVRFAPARAPSPATRSGSSMACARISGATAISPCPRTARWSSNLAAGSGRIDGW